MKQLSTTLIIILLLALPLSVAAERHMPTTWHNRLWLPRFTPLPNRHTPRQYSGFFLPPVIKQDLILSPNSGPIILPSTTHINPGVTVTLKPGTIIYANENAKLTVAGSFLSHGTAANPVLFVSNEEHPLNQTWLGIFAQDNSRVDIQYTTIEDASPAISCLDRSQVVINASKLLRGSLGILQSSPYCIIKNSLINGPFVGIATTTRVPQNTSNTINARRYQTLSTN